MNKSSNILRAVVITTILIIGTNSISISAGGRDSSIQNKFKGALRIALIGGKGFIAAYSGYKALSEATNILLIFQDLVKNGRLAKIDKWLYLGCVTCGLGMLAYVSGKSCIEDLEQF